MQQRITKAQPAMDNGLSIYPNPATTKIFIKGGDIKFIELYNATGVKIKSVQPKESFCELDINLLAKGIYLVKVINSKGENGTQKFIKL